MPVQCLIQLAPIVVQTYATSLQITKHHLESGGCIETRMVIVYSAFDHLLEKYASEILFLLVLLVLACFISHCKMNTYDDGNNAPLWQFVFNNKFIWNTNTKTAYYLCIQTKNQSSKWMEVGKSIRSVVFCLLNISVAKVLINKLEKFVSYILIKFYNVIDGNSPNM